MKRPSFLCSEFFLDILYPNRCPGCDNVIAWNKVFCEECESSLEYIGDIPWQSYFPYDIGGSPAYFDYANALFCYDGTAEFAVKSLKYRKAKSFAPYAAERLVLKLESDGIEDIDLITAVPMHKKKKLDRGYDQAELIADSMASLLGKPKDYGLLCHRKTSTEQHSLKGAKRYAAADKAYHISDSAADITGKTVLLCDDVFTTGATVNKCAALLKELGAAKVYVITICKTVRQESEPEKKKTPEDTVAREHFI